LTAPPATVVIPCRDGARHLGGMLASLALDPLAASFEVIVADNGSTDASRAVALSYRDRLPLLRVVDAAATPGRTAACNAGAAAATGDALLFVDADDEVSPGYVSAMLRALSSADLVAASIDGVRLNEPWVAATRATGIEDDGLSHYLGFLPIAGGGVLGVRRAVWESLGGLRTVPYAEDVDFSWRAQLSGYALSGAPGAVLHYRFRDTLRGIWGQAVNYGVSQPLLYRLYAADGMPRRSVPAAARDWWRLLLRARHLRSRSDTGAWLYLVGILAGRVRGSVRHRTVFL
jgi:glycosyltransferase involved in cell wall biosynthesis